MREFSKPDKNGDVSAIVAFGDFRLDLDSKCLWHAEQLVSLTPKAIETLIVLIRKRGEIVSKSELLDEVWADTFVEESTLSQNILTLRRALAKLDPGREFIVTVPRRGYRWVADIDDDRKGVQQQQSPVRKAWFANRPVLLIAAGAIGGLFVVAFLLWTILRPAGRFDSGFRAIATDTVFSDSMIRQAVVSPNGKFLALVVDNSGEPSIRLRHIADANTLEIVPRVGGRVNGIAFSPDGDYVFYSVYPASNPRVGELKKVPSIGGAIQSVLSDIDSAPAIAVDGRIAFVRRIADERRSALIISGSDGRDARELMSRPFGAGIQTASFSPDGRHLACAAFSGNGAMEIVVADTKSGESKTLELPRFSWIGQTAWLNDSSGIAFVGFRDDSADLADEIWLASFPDGESRRVATGKSGALGLSMPSDSRSILTSRANKITSFQMVGFDGSDSPKPLITKSGDNSLLPLGSDISRNGTIAFSTTQNANADVWIMNSDGSGSRQLTSDASADYAPVFDPNSGGIFFLSNRGGSAAIWAMNGDGAEPRKISFDQTVFAFDVAADGNAIFYTVVTDGIFDQRLWRMARDGSDRRNLTSQTVVSPRVSPNGELIACLTPERTSRSLKLALLSAETGEVVRYLENPPSARPIIFDWMPDGSELLIATAEDGKATLYRQPIAVGQPAKSVAAWPNETVFRLTVSPDGKSAFIEKGVDVTDVVLIRELN